MCGEWCLLCMCVIYYSCVSDQNDLCSRRGLIADSDEQTFQVSLTVKFQRQYAQILHPILAEVGMCSVLATLAWFLPFAIILSRYLSLFLSQRAEGQAHVANTHTQQPAGW